MEDETKEKENCCTFERQEKSSPQKAMVTNYVLILFINSQDKTGDKRGYTTRQDTRACAPIF
jgi:hypothetical protein